MTRAKKTWWVAKFQGFIRLDIQAATRDYVIAEILLRLNIKDWDTARKAGWRIVKAGELP